MKKILISLGAFLCFGCAIAQTNLLDKQLEKIDQSSVTSGIIYDRVMPLADLSVFNMPTEKPHNAADFRFFKQALFELHKVHFSKSKSSLVLISKPIAKDLIVQRVGFIIPLSIRVI